MGIQIWRIETARILLINIVQWGSWRWKLQMLITHLRKAWINYRACAHWNVWHVLSCDLLSLLAPANFTQVDDFSGIVKGISSLITYMMRLAFLPWLDESMKGILFFSWQKEGWWGLDFPLGPCILWCGPLLRHGQSTELPGASSLVERGLLVVQPLISPNSS